MSACPELDARIARLAVLAAEDARVEGVLLYGSWTVGEADRHSDIEAYLFVRGVDEFDGVGFVGGLGAVELAYVNRYGILAVVFDDLMRGEFHVVEAESGIAEVAGWVGLVHLPDTGRAVLVDRTGRLTRAAAVLAERRPPVPGTTAQHLVDELANWTLMVAHVLARGELARAHNLLHAVVSPAQLQLCRLLRGSTSHWLTPSRALERDLPESDVARHAATTTDDVRVAARLSWAWSRDLAADATLRWDLHVPTKLHDRIGDLLAHQG